MSRDEFLMQRLAKRDKRAMAKLYDRYHLMVWNFACRSQEDPIACEQLVLRVFEHLWKQPHEFKGDKSLAILVMECCRSKSKEVLKKKCC